MSVAAAWRNGDPLAHHEEADEVAADCTAYSGVFVLALNAWLQLEYHQLLSSPPPADLSLLPPAVFVPDLGERVVVDFYWRNRQQDGDPSEATLEGAVRSVAQSQVGGSLDETALLESGVFHGLGSVYALSGEQQMKSGLRSFGKRCNSTVAVLADRNGSRQYVSGNQSVELAFLRATERILGLLDSVDSLDTLSIRLVRRKGESSLVAGSYCLRVAFAPDTAAARAVMPVLFSNIAFVRGCPGPASSVKLAPPPAALQPAKARKPPANEHAHAAQPFLPGDYVDFDAGSDSQDEAVRMGHAVAQSKVSQIRDGQRKARERQVAMAEQREKDRQAKMAEAHDAARKIPPSSQSAIVEQLSSASPPSSSSSSLMLPGKALEVPRSSLARFSLRVPPRLPSESFPIPSRASTTLPMSTLKDEMLTKFPDKYYAFDSAQFPINVGALSLVQATAKIVSPLSRLPLLDDESVAHLKEVIPNIDFHYFQKQGIEWILNRESVSANDQLTAHRDGQWCGLSRETNWTSHEPPVALGGVLADEMGLGKTLQMIAAIVLTRKQAEAFSREVAGGVRATLICAPVSLLDQWKQQLALHAPSLRYLYYYGSREKHVRDGPKTSFNRYDIVMTTSSTARSRKEVPLTQVKFYRTICDESHLMLPPSQIESHIRWGVTGTPFPHAINDLSAQAEWIGVRNRFFPPSKLTGRPATWVMAGLSFADAARIASVIVLRRTHGQTYPDGTPIIALPARHRHKIEVELDEDERTFYEYCHAQATQAVGYLAQLPEAKANAQTFRITQHYLTPTRMAATHALLLTDNNLVSMRLASRSGEHGRTIMWQSRVPQPVIVGTHSNLPAFPSMPGAAPSRALPVRAVSSKPPPPPSPSVPANPGPSELKDAAPLRVEQAEWLEENAFCSICLDVFDEPVFTPCSHGYCLGCITSVPSSPAGVECPLCRQLFSLSSLVYHEDGKDDTDKDEVSVHSPTGRSSSTSSSSSGTSASSSSSSSFSLSLAGSVHRQDNANGLLSAEYRLQAIDAALRLRKRAASSKMNILVETVQRLISEDPTNKIVVFSSFANVTELMFRCLKTAGVETVQITGATSASRRGKALAAFQEGSVPVFLLSLRTGAVGLTLTAANHLIFTDPTIAKSVELQAVNRIYRVGQQRETHVHYLVARDTIDEAVYERGRKLEEESSRGTDVAAATQVNVDTIMSLFGVQRVKSAANSKWQRKK